MFTTEQNAMLYEKMSANLVKQRRQGGVEVSYIEGYAVIEAANRIFGFGNWEGEVLALSEVINQETKSGGGKVGMFVAYTCRYRVRVWDLKHSRCVSFDDIGYGSGSDYSQNAYGAATESATKEAVTDAMKRAFRNFGNQFGLALYDKQQRNVEGSDEPQQPAAQRKPQAHNVQSKAAVTMPKVTTQPQPEQTFNRESAIKAIEALPKYDKALHGERLAAANDRDAMAVLYHEIVGL